MYSQHCERVVYRRRYVQNTMRQRKQAKQPLKSHPARRINHGIVSLLISSVFIRYVQIVSTFQKKKRKRETIVNLIVSSSARTKKGRRKGKRNLFSPTKSPLNAPSDSSENSALLLLLELDRKSSRSSNRDQSRGDWRRNGLTRDSAFLHRRRRLRKRRRGALEPF